MDVFKTSIPTSLISWLNELMRFLRQLPAFFGSLLCLNHLLFHWLGKIRISGPTTILATFGELSLSIFIETLSLC